MEKVTIKRMKQNEKIFVSSLMTKCLIEEYGEPPDISNIETLLNYYHSREDSIIFVLKEKNIPAGFVWLVESSDLIKGDKFTCVLYLAVKKEYRGKKYSKLLLDKAKNYCKENNINEFRLSVRSNNITALNLYNNLGFSVYKHEMILKF